MSVGSGLVEQSPRNLDDLLPHTVRPSVIPRETKQHLQRNIKDVVVSQPLHSLLAHEGNAPKRRLERRGRITSERVLNSAKGINFQEPCVGCDGVQARLAGAFKAVGGEHRLALLVQRTQAGVRDVDLFPCFDRPHGAKEHGEKVGVKVPMRIRAAAREQVGDLDVDIGELVIPVIHARDFVHNNRE